MQELRAILTTVLVATWAVAVIKTVLAYKQNSGELSQLSQFCLTLSGLILANELLFLLIN